MIEYKLRHSTLTTHWWVLNTRISYSELSFEKCIYRVNGVLHPINSPEFEKAFEKEKIWEQLSDS